MPKHSAFFEHEIKRNLGDGKKSHKNLFPPDAHDYWGTVLIIIGLTLSGSGGVGGGGLLVAIIVLVFHFSARNAIPLANFTMLGNSLTHISRNFRKRHPHADRPLIDWNIVLAFLPMSLAGATIGIYFVNSLPEYIICLIVAVILLYTSIHSLYHGTFLFRREGYELLSTNDSEANEAHQQNHNHDVNIISELSLEKTIHKPQNGDVDFMKSNENQELQHILLEEKKIPKNKIIWITLLLIGVISLSLSEQAFHCNSIIYWIMVTIELLWILFVYIRSRQILLEESKLKQYSHYKYLETDVIWDQMNTIKYPLLCIVAGLVTGTFGVGGGVIFAPIMISLGIDPQIITPTSSALILFTTLVALIGFISYEKIIIDYSFYFLFLGSISAYFCQKFFDYIIDTFKRRSIIFLTIGGIVFGSAIAMLIHTIVMLVRNDTYSRSVCSS